VEPVVGVVVELKVILEQLSAYQVAAGAAVHFHVTATHTRTRARTHSRMAAWGSCVLFSIVIAQYNYNVMHSLAINCWE